MKKLCTVLVFLASVSWADTTTNRLGLDLPTCGSQNWCLSVNGDFQILDATTNTTCTGPSCGGGSSLSGPSGAIPFMSPSSTAAFDSSFSYSSTTKTEVVNNLTDSNSASFSHTGGAPFTTPFTFSCTNQSETYCASVNNDYNGGSALQIGAGTYGIGILATAISGSTSTAGEFQTATSTAIWIQSGTGTGMLFTGSGTAMEIDGGNLKLNTLTASQCLQTDSNHNVISSGGSCGGGGSGIVSPGTFTWTNTYGMSVSTLTVTSTATLNVIQGPGSGPATESANGLSGAIVITTVTPTVGDVSFFSSTWTISDGLNTVSTWTVNSLVIPPQAQPAGPTGGNILIYNDTTIGSPQVMFSGDTAPRDVLSSSGVYSLGHVAVYSSTWGSVVDGGVNGGEGNAILNQNTLQAGATAFPDYVEYNTLLHGYGPAILEATTTILGVANSSFTNVSSMTLQGAPFYFQQSTITADAFIATASSVTVIGASGLTVNGGNLSIGKGVYLGTNTVNGAYTITSTDTVVFASGTLSGTGIVSYQLPTAASACNSGTGQVIQITKVDASTGVVKVIVNGSDLIDGTTGTITLNAIGQTDEIISDCNSKWWPHGQGIQATPNSWPTARGWNMGTAPAWSASSTTVVAPLVYLSVPVSVTAYAWDSTACGIQDSVGILDSFGNVVTSTGPVACSTGRVILTMKTPANIMPGQYYIAFQASYTTSKIVGDSSTDSSMNCQSFTGASGGISAQSLTGSNACTVTPAINVFVAGGKQTWY